MLKVKSFYHSFGCLIDIEDLDLEVNNFLKLLQDQNCKNIKLTITGTKEKIIYTITYEEND